MDRPVYVRVWVWAYVNETNLGGQIHLTEIRFPLHSDLREQTRVYFKILFS